MKVLLINTNRETYPEVVFPLGLCYVAENLKKHGIEVKTYDLTFKDNDNYISELYNTIYDYSPDVIGFSIRNLDNTVWPSTIFYVEQLRELVSSIKKKFNNIPLVGGGSGFSIAPLSILSYLGLDYGIWGEGEESFLKLTKNLSSKNHNEIKRIPGIVTKQFLVPPKQISNLDFIQFPSREYLKVEEYISRNIPGNIQTKRGCGFHCSYCNYPVLEGGKYRFRSLKNVIKEIHYLKELGIKFIQFTDSVFTYPPNYAEELCNLIIKEKIKINWTCYGNPSGISKELLKTMKKAGCRGIELGIDCTTDEMLLYNGKGFRTEDIVNVTKWCKEIGIKVSLSIILGLPGETKESLNHTINLMVELSPTMVYMNIGARIYPSTPLQKIAITKGLITKDDPLFYPVFYIEPNLKGEILQIVEYLIPASSPNWIIPALNKVGDINYIKRLKERGVWEPSWLYLDISKKSFL